VTTDIISTVVYALGATPKSLNRDNSEHRVVSKSSDCTPGNSTDLRKVLWDSVTKTVNFKVPRS